MSCFPTPSSVKDKAVMSKIWKFVISMNAGVFFQFCCKVLALSGLTDLPLTVPVQSRMSPWPGAQNPLTSYSTFLGEKAFWVMATFSNLPCQTHRTLIQLPNHPSFPGGCFVWLLGQLCFCNYPNNYKNKTLRQAAQILKAHMCVWGCV